MNEIFCFSCGTALVNVLTPIYDKQTGKQISEKRCLNKKCARYCAMVLEKHDFNFWGKCKRCGQTTEY